ncbi:MAG: glycosyltransferase family 39 protein [Candidatus Woesebacteria bacterium]|nr:MAG: glycosyltransferase family 39 protein [Candidatus Woesebacteria bacterium]
MARKSILVLLGIVIMGLFLRVYRITELPMYGDELTIALDTYSIMKTGMDSTGTKLPVTFQMGSGRPGGYIYASVPFVYIFGPTEWGVRSLSILSSLGIMLLMYFLGKKLFDEKIGLIASFITSISLWDIYLARGGFEAHFALFLALFGIVSYLYGKYIPWAVAWGLTIFTYPTFKLTLPLMFLVLIWFGEFKKVIKNKFFIISVIILAVFGGLAINETFKGLSEQRFLTINILSDINNREQIIQLNNAERTFSTLPVFLKPVFFNKPFEYAHILLDSYGENLSPSFLYLRGDRNPVHNPGEWGMFYLAELPLLIIGLIILWNREKRKLILIGLWILITPLATMLLGQTHGLRNALMLPPFILLASFALSNLPRKLTYFFVAVILIQSVFVLQRVYFLAPGKFASFWSSEAKIKSLSAMSDKDSGKVITLSTKKIDNIEYAYEVYAKIDPNLVIKQYGIFPKIYGNVRIDNAK